MSKARVKTIDLSTIEWHDKRYGNTYFASRVTVNFGLKSERTFYVPFQYGYGSHSEYVAARVIAAEYPSLGVVSDRTLMHTNIRFACSENGVIYRNTTKPGLKREVKSYGKAPKS